eukprot:scaffold13157_cov41-Cyclotella_meneghiniana.AAC.3
MSSRRDSTEESVQNGKRDLSPPPYHGFDDDGSYEAAFPTIDEMLDSQSTQESVPSVAPAKTPRSRSSKQQKRSNSNDKARDEVCCPCSRSSTCSQRGGSCVCVQNKRACTNCNPLNCGKCTNTHKKRTGVLRAAIANRERMLTLLQARPRSQLSQDSASSTNTSTVNPGNTGLGSAPRGEDTTTESAERSSENNNPSSDPSDVQAGDESVTSASDDDTHNERENAGLENSTNTGVRRGDSDPTAGGTATASNAEENADRGSDSEANGAETEETDHLDSEEEEDELPQQNNNNHIGMDAGLDVSNDEFNTANELRSFDVGYRVIEEDSRLQNLTPADWKLMGVYGDTIHQNDGRHLDGGINDDAVWQRRWRKVVSTKLSLWFAPKGKIGRAFVELLAKEWRGVRERHWNAERPIVFAAVVLSRSSTVKSASGIKATIEARLKLWEAERYAELVGDCVTEGERKGFGKHSERRDTEEELSNIAR